MDLKNLLNTNESLDEARQGGKAKMEQGTSSKEPNSTLPKAGMGVSTGLANYDIQNMIKLGGGSGSVLNMAPNMNMPFMQNMNSNTSFKNFGVAPFQGVDSSRVSMSRDWREPNSSANGTGSGKPQEAITQRTNQAQGRNGHSTNTTADMKGAPFPLDLQTMPETQVSIRTIERLRNNEIVKDIEAEDGGNDLSLDELEIPIVLEQDTYESTTQNNWSLHWKPEQIEKTFSEITVVNQKSGLVGKKSIRDIRRHAENPPAEDEILLAKDIPLMHQASCLNSKKNRNCLGCSYFWKFAQTAQEEIRPWGNLDLLHFEPEHSEVFMGEIAMNGSFSPPQIEYLACDSVHTLCYSDDPNAVVLWGFISPDDVYKLREEGFGHILDQKILFDFSLLQQRVKVKFAVQQVGQTVIVPSQWTSWRIYMGRGLHVGVTWNMLRLKHLLTSRKRVEYNRTVGNFRPLNLSSLVVYAAFQRIDELETSESPREKHQICTFLATLLPVLRAQVLEELLGEHLSVSGAIVLGYDLVIDQLATSLRKGLNAIVAGELYQVRGAPLPTPEPEMGDDDDDAHHSCVSCKYLLFNSRRSCYQCKGYHLCEPCWIKHGKLHPHKMKKHRKVPVQSLLDLVEKIRVILNDHEQDDPPPPEARNARKRERREMARGDDDDNYDEEVIDCICGNNKDLGFMISCEKCYTWLHGKCVGISKRNEPEVYYCPRCVKRTSPITSKLSPRNISPEEKLKEYNLL